MKLRIKVVKIKGNCPVYKEGEEFYIEDGYKLSSKITLCMHSLASIMPYYIPLSHHIEAKELGLAKFEAKGTNLPAYVQCLDPFDYTNGGSVTFEIIAEKDT